MATEIKKKRAFVWVKKRLARIKALLKGLILRFAVLGRE